MTHATQGSVARRALDALARMPAWLTAAAEPDRISTLLASAVPELANGSLTLVGCEPRLRLKSDQPAWAVSYELELVDGGGREQTAKVAGSFSRPSEPAEPSSAEGSLAEGWRGSFPELGLDLELKGSEDKALPALEQLTDPERARRLLEDAIRVNHPDTRVRSCRPDVRRYKPGSRCTVFYELDLEPGSTGPGAVVAKTYRGDKGRNAFEGMRALWLADVNPRGNVRLAEPLAYLSDLRVLVQSVVPEETTLKERVREVFATGSEQALESLHAELAKAAAGLADVHACGVVHGETVTWKHELADVTELLDRLRPSLPDVVDSITPLLDLLEKEESQTVAQPVVPTHRSFRPAQVLIAQGRISFIDFDGLCMAEPALDVAMFRAALRDAGTRGTDKSAAFGPADVERGLAMLDAACDAFLSAYLQQAPVSPARVALWESLDLITTTLHCWTKVKPERLDTRTAVLDRHLTTSGLTG